MEEPHTLQTQNPEPPKPEGVNSETLPQTRNPDPPKPEVAEEAAAPQSQIKKRKLDNGVFHNSYYFKIRTIIKNLRPFFLEVIHAPDFRESKAAHEIRKQMKIMIELSKQLRNETTSTVEPKKLREEPPLAEANEEQVGHHQEGENHAAQPRNGEVTSLSDGVTEKVPQSDKSLNVPDKILGTTAKEKIPEVKEFAKQLEEGFQGIYVIGGSPIGWNFLVYPGSKSVYYGEAKASFLSRQAAK